MFGKLKTQAIQAKRTVLEKANRAVATQESEDFKAKLRSLDATKQTFIDLQKVGVSIYKQKKKEIERNNNDEQAPISPATMFLEQINLCFKIKSEYVRARKLMDDAKSLAISATEAAKTPGKNQEAKKQKELQAKQNEETKTGDYTTAKETLLQKIQELEDSRDSKFQETISEMCSILQAMKPDWTTSSSYQPGEQKNDFAAPSGQDAFAAPSPKLESPPSAGGDVTGPVTVNDPAPENMKIATDSESD